MIFLFLSRIVHFNGFYLTWPCVKYWAELFIWCFCLSTLLTFGTKWSLEVNQHRVARVRSGNIWIRTVTATLGFSFFYVTLCWSWLIHQCLEEKSLHTRRGANPQLWLAVVPAHAYQGQQTVNYIYIHVCVHVWHESSVEKQSTRAGTSVEPHDTADFFAFLQVNLYRARTVKIWSIYITWGGELRRWVK